MIFRALAGYTHEGKKGNCIYANRELALNLILLFKTDYIEGSDRVRLTGRRLEHVAAVHRAVVGDSLCVGILNGLIGTGTVVRLDGSALEMDVVLENEPPRKLPLTLLLALPRPKFLRRVLRSVSAMGVQRLVLLNASRVEKSYWQTPFLRTENIDEQLILGLEQTKDTVRPEVLVRPLFKPFVEDELPEMIRGSLALVAHPSAAESCPRGTRERVVLAVGPEGGFIEYEIDKLRSLGFQPVSLGGRILSVETAVPALVARLF